MEKVITKKNEEKPSLFSDFFDTERFFDMHWLDKPAARIPAVNILENGKEFRIELAAPGFSKDAFKVRTENDLLTISAEKKEEKKENSERYTRKEYSYSSFQRSFTIPKSANGEKIEATYTDGILTLVLPKKEGSGSVSRNIPIA
jgi:HSP20 family protein